MNMKNKKMILMAALVLSAAGVFGADGAMSPHGGGLGWSLDLNAKMMLLVLQIGIILFAAKLGGMLASLVRLPSVLGELGAGIVIGPWALGGIGFGSGIFQYGLFRGVELKALTDAAIAAGANTPFTVTPELYGICTIASVVLLFLSGIETNLKMFLKFAFAGSLVGIGGVVVSFLFGDLCAVYAVSLFPDLLGDVACLAKLHAYVQQGEVMKAVLDPGAMFMGIMSTATSVGITARILSERKKMDTEEGVTIMAGAVIDDVLGIIVLAIGMGIIGAQAASAASGAAAKAGVPWGSIGWTALKALGVWLGGTVLGVVLARKISWLLKLFKSPVAIAILAFGLSLVIAGLFEVLGLTLIIGAYVIGLSLSRTDIKHIIEENLQPVYTFLVPVFFCVMGMMVDLNALCSKPVLIFGSIYTVLAILAKQIGCALPTFLCGFNLKGGLRIGAGMIARGEVALIVAGIGLANGYLTQEIFGIGILMTLVTTVVAPPCLVGLFNLPGEGVRRPHGRSALGSRNVVFEMSSPMVAELMMVRLVIELRAEGFFLSELSHDDRIWSAAMDDIEFSIQCDGPNIRFSCTPAEEAMVMTAWMEVASQMNDLARAISKPIRREDVGRMLKNPAAAAKGRSSVGRYLQGFVMLPKFRAASKREAIEKMVAEIARACPNHVKDAAAATAAVLKREDSMPTGLDHGIAVPHGRCAEVTGIAGAVAILDNEGTANGCIPDYETIDNSTLQIIVLTLANDEQQTPYLQLMSFISRALRAGDGYKSLLACTTADEMRKFFRSAK